MGEQLRMRAPAHYLRVDLSDPAEREYWLVVLDAGRAELEHAVACAGPELWNVRDWLRMQRRAAPACETDAGPASPAPCTSTRSREMFRRPPRSTGG